MADRFELQVREQDVALLPVVGVNTVELSSSIGRNKVRYTTLTTTESALLDQWRQILESECRPYRCRKFSERGASEFGMSGSPEWI
jgi:hypothetical protein